MDAVNRYLVVRATDGAILADFPSPACALKALLEHADLIGPDASLVRFNDRQGELVGMTSLVSVTPARLRP
jgi:hypothetical protein